MQKQITKEIINKIEVNIKECLRTKTISVEEFVSIFQERFNERTVSVSYNNGFVNAGISFERAEIEWYVDNSIHFYESDGEVPYSFEINLNDIVRIEMIDYWLDGLFQEMDYGAQFAFVGKDRSEIIFDCDK